MVLLKSPSQLDVMVSTRYRLVIGSQREHPFFFSTRRSMLTQIYIRGGLFPQPDPARVVVERLAPDEPFALADGSLGFVSKTDGNATGDQALIAEEIEV
jgi:hypothetical protein